jgi:hypothetical protein
MQEFIALSVATTEDLGAGQLDGADDDEEQAGPLAAPAAREYQPLSSSDDDERDNGSQEEEFDDEMEPAPDFQPAAGIYVHFSVHQTNGIGVSLDSTTSFLKQLPPSERDLPLQ